MARPYIVSGAFVAPALRQSEYLAIEGDYRRAYGELHVAMTWLRHCQKAVPAEAEAERLAADVVDRLLR